RKPSRAKNRWLRQAGLVAHTSPDWRLRRSGIININEKNGFLLFAEKMSQDIELLFNSNVNL
ncbi:hypothetical protein B7988_08280, partial [Fibrobacter sp. UWB1]|uniref:hypothetical protein n=1 Tax=Fibrobacter sp. UWB1 TaxID=1964355 RepID=UPI000B6C54B9